MNLDEFMSAMDEQQPDWFIDLADERDLKNFIKEYQSNIESPSKLRLRTGSRLFVCARATHQYLLKIN